MQKKKVASFWVALKVADQIHGTNEIKKIVDSVHTHTLLDASSQATARASTTSASKMARLAFIMESPEAAMLMTLAAQPLRRVGLDARQSGDADVAESVDPYVQLAALFN